MNYQTTLRSFFWQIMKPYKWWLLLMLQAPVIGAFFVPVNNYAIKLIADQISKNQDFTLQQIMFPVILFCAASKHHRDCGCAPTFNHQTFG